MYRSTFGYKEDVGSLRFNDPRFIGAVCVFVLMVATCGVWLFFEYPQQDEVLQKKLCERTGGRWVYDHSENTGDEPIKRVYACRKDRSVEPAQPGF